MQNTVEAQIREFIEDNFLFREDVSGLADDASLLESGLMDSTGVLELVGFLESDLGIKVLDAEITPENLDTIASIIAFAEGKRQQIAAA